jgi:ADP-heptose:LPS heptosyltransferase
VKNILLKIFLSFLQKFIPKQQTKNEKILVVSTTALGDTLWALPALQSLKDSLPNAKICLLTKQIGLEIFQNSPFLDQIFLLKEPFFKDIFSLWRALKKEKFDTILIFHTSQRLTLPLCALLGANTIVGSSGINKGLDYLLTKKTNTSYQHEIDRRLSIINEIGAKVTTKTMVWDAPKSLREKTTKWIAIHPGSKDLFKRWPIDYFAKVANELIDLGYEVFITGNEVEKPLLYSLREKTTKSQIFLPKSLEEFGSFLKHVDLLISNDTGPVHLAASIQTPLLALYGPTDPNLCGPTYAKDASFIAKKPTCSPCLKKKCKVPFCLLQIGPDEVISLAKTKLS